MRLKSLAYILIGFGLISCSHLGHKVNLFKKVDFKEKADWLFVKTNTDFDTCVVITDKEVLLQLHDDLEIRSTKECGGTTPDHCLDLYKNGERISALCYCSWETLSYKFGRLKNEFIAAELKSVKANTIGQHNRLLDSLKQLDNIYLLYPRDTIIEFPGQLIIDTRLIDNDQDIFKQEKPIEEEFKRIFKNGYYSVKADFFLSAPGNPSILGYHVTVDCDSSFLDIFNTSILSESELFKEMTAYKYQKKDFKIKYYKWNE